MEAGPHVLADRYELLSPVARGGMGQVWRARDRLLHRPVAVKILRSEFTDDPAFRARFRAEAQHAAMLMHPNIASVFDYGEVPAGTGESVAFLVMELVDGESLSALLQREGRLDASRTLSILRQTAAALAAAHAAGIVHRDVKPGNVLVTPGDTVKITDFGVAWSASSVPLTGTGQVIGTAHYFSPEQARGAKATAASDVYALGAVAYECLAGRRLFDGENSVQIALRHIRDDPDPLPGDVPADVRDLVMRALAKDPAARYPDGAALLAATEHVSGQSRAMSPTGTAVSLTGTAVLPLPFGFGGDAPPTGYESPTAYGSSATEEPARRGATIWAALGALLAVLAVVGVVLLDGVDPTAETSPGNSPTSSGPASSTAPTSPVGVEIVAADLVGRPVADVRAELVGLGLAVQLEPVTTPEVAEGEVLAVEPTGPLPQGATVTVRYAVAPVPTSEPAPAEPGNEEKDEEKDDGKPGRGNGRGGGGG
jgi:hypothetical protein